MPKTNSPGALIKESAQILALQSSNAELKALVRALKSENLRLQHKVASIEAKRLTADNRVKALEKSLKKHQESPFESLLASLTDADLDTRISEFQNEQKSPKGRE